MSEEKLIDKSDIEYRKNNLYDWLEKRVIYKCTDLVHLEACAELIDIFASKGGEENDVKKLKASLQLKEEEIRSKNNNQSIEDRVMKLFNQGTHNVLEISKELNISLYKVDTIIDAHFNKSKRKNK